MRTFNSSEDRDLGKESLILDMATLTRLLDIQVNIIWL